MMQREQKIRVLQTERDPDARTNAYISQLFGSLREAGVEVLGWSIRRALFSRYDVVHVHWPEFLVRKRSSAKATVARVIFVLVLMRANLCHHAIVRTVHNLEPHEDVSRLEKYLLRKLEERTTLRIHLTAASLTCQDSPDVVIRHGHYKSWYASYEKAIPTLNRAGYVGSIRPYKGVDSLITAFSRINSVAELLISGHSISAEYFGTLSRLSASDPRILIENKFLEDGELVERITACQLIVLPHRKILNSGVALLALSLGRPILAPAVTSILELQQEIGSEWVIVYEDDLDPEDIENALEMTKGVVAAPSTPALDSRNWPEAAQAHRDAYRRAINLIRNRETPVK